MVFDWRGNLQEMFKKGRSSPRVTTLLEELYICGWPLCLLVGACVATCLLNTIFYDIEVVLVSFSFMIVTRVANNHLVSSCLALRPNRYLIVFIFFFK